MIRKLSIIAAAASVLVLAGCATNADYTNYANAQQAIAVAKYTADAAKYTAMASIANSATGDASAKVAGMMALALAGNGGAQGAPDTSFNAPVSGTETALRWAQILVPSTIQGFGIYSNTKLGLAQSENSYRLGVSTNNTFAEMAGKIQAPVVVVPAVADTNYSVASPTAP